MNVHIFDMADHDAMELFFGDEQKHVPLQSVLDNHCELLWSGQMGALPDLADVVMVPEDEGSEKEYILICRAFKPEANRAILIVHERHYAEVSLS